jgi:parallel beta-helix repeat protein
MWKRLGKIAFAVVVVAGVAAAGMITANAQVGGRSAAVLAGPADVPPPVSGKTITVGPNGDYATIQEAADVAQPGDNVEIAAGSYEGGLNLSTSGESGKYITFYGKGGAAIVTGGGGEEGLIAIGSSSWLRFIDVTSSGSGGFGIMANGASDLVFQNVAVDGSQDGGLVLLNTSNVLVDGCDISGTNAEGTSADHEAMSLGSGGTNIEVRGCRVYDNGEEGIDVKYADDAQAKIHDNVVYGNRGPNIYVDSSSNVDIFNNTVYSTGDESKAGIMLAVENYSESRVVDNVKVYNNVLYGNANAGLTFWKESDGTIGNIQIVNNTFYGNASGAVTSSTDIAGTNLLRNNIFGEGDVALDNFVTDTNLTGDPGFVDAAGGDFHLVDGSGAIDTGSADSAPTFDRDYTTRPTGAGVDIGAYER